MARTTPSELRSVLHTLDEAYNRKAWHGPTLRGAIRGLSPRQAAWRPGSGRHNIWEIAVHAAYWKYAVWRRLVGARRGAFPHKGSNWFPRPVELSEKAWRADVALLEEMHRRVREAVVRLPKGALLKQARGGKWSNLRLIAGIALHDIYHAGQIQLLKRLQKAT